MNWPHPALASLLLLCLCPRPGFADDVVVLPNYDVSAAVIAKMMPREQIAEISGEAAESSTFRFSEVLMAKAPYSKFPRAVKCLVRDKDGHVTADVTNDRLTVGIDPTWKDGFLSSNQPAEYSIFYLLLRPRWQGTALSIGYCRRLLGEYVKFSRSRLDTAARHYGAGRFSIGNLYWFTMPDQVTVAFKSPTACVRAAQATGVAAEGTLLRLNQSKIDELLSHRGESWSFATADEIECVTPSGSLGPPPEIRDGAALFPIGWVEYRKNGYDHGIRDLIAVSLWRQ